MLYNNIAVNIQFNIKTIAIAKIDSIDIVTFVYLINNKYNAVNPTYAIPVNNPFDLYFIVNIIIAITAITVIAITIYVKSCFDIFDNIYV